MKIVVLAGGLSTERDVSITSGTLVANALRERGHKVVLLDVYKGYEENICDIDALFKENYDFTQNTGIAENLPDLQAVKNSRKDKTERFLGRNVAEICTEADITFFALHGDVGENGKLQATFDILGIKYTGSGYLGSALAMDKGLTKSVLIQNNITTPAGQCFTREDKENGSIFNWNTFPCVVKPCSGGSSVGISKADNEEEFMFSVEDAFKYEEQIVVEQFVKGREFSVGVIEGRALPPIEIIPKTGFYDYKAKYQAGLTDEICPANIDTETDKKLRSAAENCFKALKLSAYGRVDFLLDEKGDAYCLEANSLPGMTPMSLLPQEAAVEGMSYGELCEKIIEVSLKKYN